MADSFKIKIKIDPNEEPVDIPSDPKNCAYYHCSSNEDNWDKVYFNVNKIYICGERTNTIRDGALYTVRSTYYFDMIKAAIYYLYTWGGFRIESIDFYVKHDGIEQEAETKIIDTKDILQNFVKTPDEKIDQKVLNGLFNARNTQNDLTTILIYQIYGNAQDDFNSTWRAFNHIYNVEQNSTADLGPWKELLDSKRELLCQDHELLSLSKKFTNGLKESRIIRWLTYNERNISVFRNNSGIDQYSDSHLIDKLTGICKNIFSESDLETKDARRNYRSLIKKSSMQENDFDYLKFAIHYAYFQRNKYFHGEFREQLILRDNDVKKELSSLNKIIQKLNYDLIKTDAEQLMKE